MFRYFLDSSLPVSLPRLFPPLLLPFRVILTNEYIFTELLRHRSDTNVAEQIFHDIAFNKDGLAVCICVMHISVLEICDPEERTSYSSHLFWNVTVICIKIYF